MALRITTWNVNGIRNPFSYQPWRDNRSFEAMFDILEADIVVMQELKIQRKDLKDDMVLVPGWDCYFSLPKHKKGYSGVGIYTRQATCAPIRAEEGVLGVLCPPNSSIPYRDLSPDTSIGGYPTYSQIADLGVDPAALDAEGRCVVLEFPAFVLLGVYSPANSNGLRDDFRFAFWSALDMRIRNLDQLGKRVVLTGDLNVSRDEMDTAGGEDDRRKMGASHEEYISTPNRRIFNQLLEGGEVVGERDQGREQPVLWDICRALHEGRKGMYTHWEQKINARPGNYGSRIDYVLCSVSMKDWIIESDIQEGLMGSDHCPVYAVCKQSVSINGKDIAIKDVVNPQGCYQEGLRVREPLPKERPAFSARLLPEFDRRRTIQDMFRRQTSNNIQPPPVVTNAGEWHNTVIVSQAGEVTDVDIGTDILSQRLDSAPFSPPKPSPTAKRKTQAGSDHARNKRTKSNTLPSANQRSQQTLKGFFLPKQSQESQEGQEQVSIDRSPSIHGTASAIVGNAEEGSAKYLATNASTSPVSKDKTPPVVDPIESKKNWTKLFAKPRPPLCESHKEPCITLETKKKGFNCGRSFWICPR
ncbi:DNA lyase Apn2 [Tothia fuscella]|uniref:DNA-(apurinic or apyrimidinic site) endonuclease 2 n=1 Tax=Tothia fuscella TaxID=1048955 RepID=A0A9P4U1H3_9PEZI|nr:DNA lyase Apn2 [Tothia fuscella]